MKKEHSNAYYIVIFSIAQIIWLLLLGIWIYWYIKNNIIFERVGDEIAPQILHEDSNVFAFIGGLILLVSIWLAMGLAFRHLNVQLRTTQLYDTFISNVTHELKSPLSSIRLYLETMLSRDVPKETREEFYKTMLKDSERLQNLINSILEIAALGRKSIHHNFQIYEADELLKNIIKESAEQQKLDEQALSVIGTANCQCVVDAEALKIVFDNLLNNAIKYSFDKPQITINISCTSKTVVVSIKDKGIGIPTHEKRKVFNKFYRVQGNDIPNVKGTGLGLYWIKEILNKHGGTISLYSEGKDKGSNFFLEIPVYQKSKKYFVSRLLKKTKKNKD